MDELSTLGLLVAVSGIRVVFIDECDIEILQVCYLSIDVHFVLFREEFEYGSSVSVLTNRATRRRKLQLETEKFLKRSYVFKARPPTLLLTSPFSYSTCVHNNR